MSDTFKKGDKVRVKSTDMRQPFLGMAGDVVSVEEDFVEIRLLVPRDVLYRADELEKVEDAK
jgi:hypothetical protein